MTALKPSGSTSSPQTMLGIVHKCLRRKSPRTYELLDPKRPGETMSFDVGQIKEIVLMDGRLRQEEVVTSVPAGYIEFATRFNKYATGPERFATYIFIKQKLVISKEGSPVVWEHFLIDDSLVGWHPDLPSSFRPVSDIPASDNVFSERAGDSITQVLSAYMKGASTTTEELTRFWIERGAIELQYASSLAQLAEKPFGQHEPSEFRNVIDGFRLEAARQAMAHNTLATQIAVDLEARCLELKSDQRAHLREICEPAVKRLQEEPIQDSSPSMGISFEWKKEYRNLRHRLDMPQFEFLRNFKLRRETLSLRRNYFADDLGRRLSPITSSTRSREWEDLVKSCEEMEGNRSQFMKDLLSAYADILTSIEAADHESHNNIMRTFDLFRSEDVLEDFVKHFMTAQKATGDPVSRPPVPPVDRLQAAPLPAPPSSFRVMSERAVDVQRRSTVSGLGRFSGPRPRPFTLRPSSQIIDSDSPPRPSLDSRPSSIHILPTASFSQTMHAVDESQNHGRSRPPLPKLQTNFARDYVS